MLRVVDGATDRWFFRQNVLNEELERRFLLTQRKMEEWHMSKKKNLGHLNARREDCKTLGCNADAGYTAPYGTGGGSGTRGGGEFTGMHDAAGISDRPSAGCTGAAAAARRRGAKAHTSAGGRASKGALWAGKLARADARMPSDARTHHACAVERGDDCNISGSTCRHAGSNTPVHR